jgi:hypothetical protein
MPILIYTPGMTFLGDPNAPETTVVDTSPMTMFEELSIATPMSTSAFEIIANNVTITGFEITNSSNTVPVNGSLVNYGIAVGYTGMITSTGVEPQFILPGDCVFTNNTIQNMSAGFYLDICRNVTIQYNKLKGNAVGINLTELCDANSTEIHYNDIAGNTEYGVNNNNGEDRFTADIALPSNWVNATYNWWGSYLGPYHETLNPDGTGDNVTDYVLFEPWLIVPVFSSQYEYHLVAGWNLIGVPLDIPDNSIAGFFPEDVRDNIYDIWGWDESAQDWMYYAPNPADYYYQYYPALTNLETGRAYWVEMSDEAYFQIEGTVPDCAPQSPVPLVPTWNFMALTGTCSSSPSDMYPAAYDVWGWDESAQDWVYYSPNPSDYYYQYYPQLTQIQPGYGYWVEMPEEV